MFADILPILFIVSLAAGVLWILWRVIRRLFRAPAERQEPSLRLHPDPSETRQEPILRPVAAPPSAIPDAADVLALKAAIDNLARQVAALERRLASGELSPQVSQPIPPATTMERAPAPLQAPPVVLDHRR